MPNEHDCPEFVEALLDYLTSRLALHYGNTHDYVEDCPSDNDLIYEPEYLLNGIEYRCYYWGHDEIWAAKPNFAFNGVEVRWYKRQGRGQTVNLKQSAAKWVKWFNDCLAVIEKAEKDLEQEITVENEIIILSPTDQQLFAEALLNPPPFVSSLEKAKGSYVALIRQSV